MRTSGHAMISRTSMQIYPSVLFPALLLLTGIATLTDYLEGTTSILLTGLAAIAATATKTAPARPYRYAVVAMILLALTWLVPVKTLLYLSLAFCLFFWIELHAGAVHLLGVFALFLSSPAFHYTAGVFSFPLRLQLTKLVGTVFSLFATDIELKANVISYRGHEFAVDPACMGLHMLSLSLLLGILLAGLLQQKTGRLMNWKTSLLYLCSLFVLNLFANVLRIILLVQFAIPPEAVMHDIIGLICLLLYVCVPACFLAKYFVARSVVINTSEHTKQHKGTGAMQWLLLAALVMMALRVTTIDTYSPFSNKHKQAIASYTSSVYAPGILKLENQTSLLYVKFIRGFYDTEHNPMFCWKGSGYELKDVKKQKLAGTEIYTAILQKENEKLYTAWWYGNGKHNTTSQWDWRWRMLKGETGYAVLNVTAASKKVLMQEVDKILSTGKLMPLFH